jgi:hypothetical protein
MLQRNRLYIILYHGLNNIIMKFYLKTLDVIFIGFAKEDD